MNNRFDVTYTLDLCEFNIGIFRKIVQVDSLPHENVLISIASPFWGHQRAQFKVGWISQTIDGKSTDPQFTVCAKPTGVKLDYKDAVNILPELGWTHY